MTNYRKKESSNSGTPPRRFLITPLVLVILLSAVGCSSLPYKKSETARMTIKERIYSHHYKNGLTLSIVCRENAGTATVAARLTNNSSLPLTLNDSITLFIQGNKGFSRVNPKKVLEIQPEESVEMECSYTFQRSFKRGADLIFPGEQTVYIMLDTYKTPSIYLDLSADNQFPFRFANHP